MYKNTCYEVQRHLTCGATKSRKQEAVLNMTQPYLALELCILKI